MSTISPNPPMPEDRAALQKKYYPHTPWTAEGPVRRQYMATAEEGVLEALSALAAREFLAPEERAVTGDGAECLALLRQKEAGAAIGLILGRGADAFWCDIAALPREADGWQRLLVRTEEGENLIALAHARGAIRFRRA